MAMWRCESLLLTSHAAVALRSSTLGLRRSPRIAMALAPGTKVEGALLKQLKVSGRRAAVFVVPSDQSSIEVFERCEARASEFKSLGCTPIAIRPADAALVDTATTYPSVSFLDDAPKVHALMEPHTPLRARSAPHLRAHPRLPPARSPRTAPLSGASSEWSTCRHRAASSPSGSRMRSTSCLHPRQPVNACS